jgi:hypothetical protein
VLIVLAGALSTSVLLTADAFFAFAGWRALGGKASWGRDCVRKVHAFTEKREPLFAAVAMFSAAALAVRAGTAHPQAACLAGGALVALGAHLLVHLRTACLMRAFEAAPIGSAEWSSRGAKLDAAMVTRASLQAASLICILAAGLLT